MERKFGFGHFILGLVFALVIVQSWIVIKQNSHIVKHLEKISAKKMVIKDGKVYDEEGNFLYAIKKRDGPSDGETVEEEDGGVTVDEGGDDEGEEGYIRFVDVGELMEKAGRFKFTIGRTGGSLSYAVPSAPKTFNLILNREASTSDVLRYAYDPLVRVNYITGEWDGVLAESWETSDDGLECIVHLRKDVKFFDGEPLTADDVIFTYNDLLNNKSIDVGNKSAMIFRDWDPVERKIVEKLMKVEKVDDYAVRFIFPWRTYSAISKLNQMIYPKHVLKKYVDDGTYNTTWDVSTPPEKIIGSGPWRPWRYYEGERFVMVRNPNYWMKDRAGNSLPYLEKVVFNVVKDHSTALLKFQGGEIDFLALTGADVQYLVPKQERGGFRLFGTGPSSTVSYFCFNLNGGSDPETGKPYVAPHKLKWFSNLKFRRAMAHMLDKRTWIENQLYGFGTELWSPLSPASTEFYNPNVTKYPYDPERAGELLDELGYKDRDGDKIREDPDGNPIEFVILTGARDERQLRPIIVFIADLETIGVKARYVIQQYNSFLSMLWTTYDFECTFIGELAGEEVGGISGLFTTWSDYRFYKPNYTSMGREIRENMKNKEPWEETVDELFSKYEKELDREKRKKIGFEIQKVISDNLPVIFTVIPDRIYGISNKYRNVNPTVRFYPIIWPMMEYTYETD